MTVSKAQQLRLTQRRAHVVKCMALGWTYEMIANSVKQQGLGTPSYDRSMARKDAMTALDQVRSESVNESRAKQLIQVNAMLRTLLRRGHSGDVEAAKAALGYLKRWADLEGLDAPKRSQMEITTHFDQLASLANGALLAGLNAANLTPEQRKAAVAGMQNYLTQVKRGQQPAPEHVQQVQAIA